MTTPDPTLPRYGDLVIRGTTLGAIASATTAHLDGPWSRASDIEDSWSERGHGGDTPLVFHHAADGRLPGAHLYIFARNDGDLYVSNVVPTESSQLTPSEYNALLRSFHEEVATPAAADVGAAARLDDEQYDLAERAGPVVRDALVAFSRTANRSTGTSHPNDAERFDDFVIAASALPSDRRPSANTIGEWLMADGWADEAAWDLAIEYERGLRLLDRSSTHGH